MESLVQRHCSISMVCNKILPPEDFGKIEVSTSHNNKTKQSNKKPSCSL
jgi:hypothetical protein